MAFDENARKARENAYLQHMLIFLESGETSSSFFRTLVDNWYAYYRGDAFLKSTGSPLWFNAVKPKDLNSKGRALSQMDFVSENAEAVLTHKAQGILVKDHAVPVKLLRDRLIEEQPTSLEPIREFLCTWYKLGVITEEEHRRLSDLGCKDKMPSEWDGRSVFARYEFAEIVSR